MALLLAYPTPLHEPGDGSFDLPRFTVPRLIERQKFGIPKILGSLKGLKLDRDGANLLTIVAAAFGCDFQGNSQRQGRIAPIASDP